MGMLQQDTFYFSSLPILNIKEQCEAIFNISFFNSEKFLCQRIPTIFLSMENEYMENKNK